MRRPRITKRVLNGLSMFLAPMSAELEAGEEGYFAGFSTKHTEDAEKALEYIRNLRTWYHSRRSA